MSIEKIGKWYIWLMIGCLLVTGMIVSFIFLFQHTNTVKYQNPVFEPVFADPSLIQAEDGYIYAYGTEDDWGDGMGLKKIPIIRSKDLVDWEYVGNAFYDHPPQWKDGFLWAPHAEYMNDQYYLYYSMSLWGDSDPGIGVAVSDKPEGPFTDKGPLFTSSEMEVSNSIDPFYIKDIDGVSYMVWGSFHGIYGIELTEDGLQTVGEKFKIAGNSFEAPWIIEKDGAYYFFGSLGSCCEGELSTYRVAVGKAESIKGPYLDKNGDDLLLSQGTLFLAESNAFAGPGHNSIITDKKGTDWFVYHAIDKEDSWLLNGATRRPMMIDPIVWENGWPTIKNAEPSGDVRKAPAF